MRSLDRPSALELRDVYSRLHVYHGACQGACRGACRGACQGAHGNAVVSQGSCIRRTTRAGTVEFTRKCPAVRMHMLGEHYSRGDSDAWACSPSACQTQSGRGVQTACDLVRKSGPLGEVQPATPLLVGHRRRALAWSTMQFGAHYPELAGRMAPACCGTAWCRPP